MLSLLVQVTVVPADTVIVAGENAIPAMVTALGATGLGLPPPPLLPEALLLLEQEAIIIMIINKTPVKPIA